jgi:hypothetical protein
MNYKKRSIKSTLKKRTRDSGSNILNSISNILTSKSHFVRIVWSLFVLVFTLFLGFQAYNSICRYINGEIRTRIVLMPIQVDDFPGVILRPINWFDYYFYQSNISTSKEPKDFITISNHKNPQEDFTNSRNRFEAEFIVDSSTSECKELFNKKLLEKMIVFCEYDGVKCDRRNFTLIEASLHEPAYLMFKPSNKVQLGKSENQGNTQQYDMEIII